MGDRFGSAFYCDRRRQSVDEYSDRPADTAVSQQRGRNDPRGQLATRRRTLAAPQKELGRGTSLSSSWAIEPRAPCRFTGISSPSREAEMNWNRRYAIRSYLLSTIWTAPVVALVLEQAMFRLMSMENFDFGWVPGFALDREGAIAGADSVNNCVPRFHLQLAACGYSGGEWPADPSDHCDHAAARQRYPLVGRCIRLRSRVCGRSKKQSRNDPPFLCQPRGDRWTKQRGRVPVFNRPCCTAAASGQHRGANSSAGTQSLRRRLSQPHTSIICTFASSRKAWPPEPDGLTPWKFCDRHCSKS